MAFFDHDFVRFDEFGIVKMLCMRCGIVIKERQAVAVPSSVDSSKTILATTLLKNSSYREVEVKLSDGSYTCLKFCKACVKEDIDYIKAMDQIRRAHTIENEMAGLTNDPASISHGKRLNTMQISGRLSEEEKTAISVKGV